MTLDTINPERAPRLGVALRFFATGIAYLAAMLVLAAVKAPILAFDYLHNAATLGVTHLFVLGFAGSVAMGALYQLIPVLLHATLRSEPAANLHLGVHASGVLAMVAGFLQFNLPWIIAGGSLITGGACLFFWNMASTGMRAERRNWHGAFVGVALLYFAGTLTWGLIMAFNMGHGFLGENAGATLGTHLALGLLGWYSLLIVSVGLKLVPMFAPARFLPPRAVAAVSGTLAVGVAVTIAGLWLSGPLVAGGLLLTAAALLAFAGTAGYTYLHRRTGPLDFSVRFAVIAFPFASRDWQAGLVVLFALAWVGGTILGMLQRIVPFMVWLHRFRNRTHKQERIPFLHETYQPRLAWIAYLAWFPGALLLSAGIAVHMQMLIAAGSVIALAGLGGFVLAQRQVLHHVPPGTAPLFPGRK